MFPPGLIILALFPPVTAEYFFFFFYPVEYFRFLWDGMNETKQELSRKLASL